jgi:hypothetical protein
MINEKKIDLTLDLGDHLIKEIKGSKYIKGVVIGVSIFGGILIFGFGMKVFDYAAKNYLSLKTTLKQ